MTEILLLLEEDKILSLALKYVLENQIKFINNVKFYTDYGLYIHKNTDFMIINELNNLSKIF
jgi:hypothetical protein